MSQELMWIIVAVSKSKKTKKTTISLKKNFWAAIEKITVSEEEIKKIVKHFVGRGDACSKKLVDKTFARSTNKPLDDLNKLLST